MKTFYKLTKSNRLSLAIITISCLVITYYRSIYNLSTRVIVYHLTFVLLGNSLSLLIGYLLLYLSKYSNYLKYLYSALLGILLVTQIVVYLLAFGGNEIINYPITIKIFWIYISQFNNTIQTFGIPYWIAYLVCFFIPACMIGGFIAGSNQIWRALAATKHELGTTSNFGSKLSKAVLALSAVVSLGFISYKPNEIPFAQQLELVREPLYTVLVGDGKTGVTLANNAQLDQARESYPKNIRFNKKNIILIVVDALRADYLNVYGYPESNTPFLSDLHQRGHLHKVDYSFATSTYSFPGILSILRSKYLTKLYSENFSIQDLLKDQGYKVNFILSGDHTNFYDLKSYYGSSIDFYFDGTNSKKFSINDDALLLEGLDKNPDFENNPSFFYFHLMSVHPMGLRHDKSKRHLPAGVDFKKNLYENNYKNGILQADGYIKDIFEKLDQKGFLKNSIVIITADHGESIGENNTFAHGHGISNREIHTPLLIYDEDSKVSYRTNHATQPDIAVTIVDRLGLPTPHSWEGESLLKKSKNPFSFHANLLEKSYALIHYNREKILEYRYSPAKKQEEVFDLKNDPNENHNLLGHIDKQLLASFRQSIKPTLQK
jgi:glucan phosphoethanolaminetransferase (alkaline phosphatase superfamily)